MTSLFNRNRYPDQIAKFSWFPTDNVWNNTGFNVGHWNGECETWYIERRHQILNEMAQPRVSSRWRSNLRMTRAASRVYYQANLAALNYIQSSFASPILYVEVWNWTLCWRLIFQSSNSSKNVIFCYGWDIINCHRASHPSRPDKASRAMSSIVSEFIMVQSHTCSLYLKHNTLSLRRYHASFLSYVLGRTAIDVLITNIWTTCVWTWGFWYKDFGRLLFSLLFSSFLNW